MTPRESLFHQLLRSLTRSAGEFVLLLARCNSTEVRDQIVADLRSHFGPLALACLRLIAAGWEPSDRGWT